MFNANFSNISAISWHILYILFRRILLISFPNTLCHFRSVYLKEFKGLLSHVLFKNPDILPKNMVDVIFHTLFNL